MSDEPETLGTAILMDVKEFMDAGYLAEVNRCVLHPLGLALAVTVDDDDPSKVSLYGVWDDRDDPEGWYCGPGPEDDESYMEDIAAKVRNVAQLWRRREKARRRALKYMIQPIPGVDDPATYWEEHYRALIDILPRYVKYDVRGDLLRDANDRFDERRAEGGEQ